MLYSGKKIWLAVDCLVFGYDIEAEDLKVLAFKRKVEPLSGQWSLIGGIVNPEEDLDVAAGRILKQFTGLEGVFLEQLTAFGKSERDPVGRVVSILFWSLIKLDSIQKDLVEEYEAHWYSLAEVPQLVLDHTSMLAHGITHLISNAKRSPLGFELLPEKFTLPQLLRLYEAIYGGKIDDRNFRKKILATGLLIRLNEKDKSSSKKGAFLYRFDQKRYSELAKGGYYLDLLG